VHPLLEALPQRPDLRQIGLEQPIVLLNRPQQLLALLIEGVSLQQVGQLPQQLLA
jgi:hypothetical protein